MLPVKKTSDSANRIQELSRTYVCCDDGRKSKGKHKDEFVSKQDFNRQTVVASLWYLNVPPGGASYR